MAIYKKPEKRVHRGFYYLNDETVINSLSAVEAGKVDEVVAKVNSSREGGFGGGAGFQGAKIEGGKKSTSAFEEEIVRTRTRFSIFELWYQNLVTSKAIGQFRGWGQDALEDVDPGDTVELRASLTVVPLQAMFRMFLWFANLAKSPGHMFSQKGDELKTTKESERNIRMLVGDADEMEFVVIAKPVGNAGPIVAMQLADRWMIGNVGHLSGHYTVVGQVDQVLTDGDEVPTMRLIREAPPTPLEVNTLGDIVEPFIEPASAFGVSVSRDDAAIKGPGLWLTPIAIFR
ncbi:hypothetical protein [Actinopolymorpha sp. B9G3]|uniref:DUF6414 family protein n=1 Tax=Actinopolymorpha sp. B9G3 TaxID=3158970 RepID=UPI0032D8D50D